MESCQSMMMISLSSYDTTNDSNFGNLRTFPSIAAHLVSAKCIRPVVSTHHSKTDRLANLMYSYRYRLITTNSSEKRRKFRAETTLKHVSCKWTVWMGPPYWQEGFRWQIEWRKRISKSNMPSLTGYHSGGIWLLHSEPSTSESSLKQISDKLT